MEDGARGCFYALGQAGAAGRQQEGLKRIKWVRDELR